MVGNLLRLLVILLYMLGLASFVVAAFLFNLIAGFITVGICLMLTVLILVKESGM
ncbi:MAG: hypothetical protein L0M06_09060 [Enterococcus sp.]|uniref:hypothetical protein n=1 Tax=Enterococcus sp. TaxID=35783 RepID=UPI002649FB70|nr:hypothetical protein [Enterococcus sp.]MDN6002618.1 hypothetical protein [Enterococcus sp.]MDN6560002.1 hypothetical protein [Enterococcus sp.]MDN6753327.1 hypothetical protein [Enterococcus sp.]MDN6776691.1 hypothetical protein [Enterococcus sp.]